MKKILFSAVNLGLGGIETALVTLLNYLAEEKENDIYKYEITLVLEQKQGLFLDALNNRIAVEEYSVSNNSNILMRKTANFIHQRKFLTKYKNKFDFSCSYATYSNPGAFVARNASKNSVLWCHMDYLALNEGNVESVKAFFEEKKYNEFNNIVFVSEKSKETFLQVFPEMKQKTLYINNLIDYKTILEKAKEKIDEDSIEENDKNNENKQSEIKETIFINVSRHDENQKRISRIIEASRMLKADTENIKFKVMLVGDGKSLEDYKKMVMEYDLEENVIFLGRKKNPYPYYNIADCVLLTSDYEGSPVVYTEAMVLNKPIITTEVAGSEQIKDKYGIIVKKDENDIYLKMKQFAKSGYKMKEEFDPKQYNREALEQIEKIISKE